MQETPGEQRRSWREETKSEHLYQRGTTQLEWTKDSWFSLSQRVHFCVCSVCDLLSVDSGFGYIHLSFYLLPASQLSKVSIGHSYYFAFNSVFKPCALPKATQHGRVFFNCGFFPSGKGLCNKDTVMSWMSPGKYHWSIDRHKRTLVGLFIYRLVKPGRSLCWEGKVQMISSEDLLPLKKIKEGRSKEKESIIFKSHILFPLLLSVGSIKQTISNY